MDDGGPLECNGTLTGIIPKIYNCNEQLSVYISVFPHKQWILDNSKSSSVKLQDFSITVFFTIVWIVWKNF